MRLAMAHRFRLAREMAGLSQAQAARLLWPEGNGHQGTLSYKEKGANPFSIQEAVRAAEIYSVSVNWLLLQRPLKLDTLPEDFIKNNRDYKLLAKDADHLLTLLAATQE